MQPASNARRSFAPRFPPISFAALAACALALGGCSKSTTQDAKTHQAEALSGEGPIVRELKADPQNVDAEGPRLAKLAAAEHKRVLFYFGAEWCPPCLELKKAFHRDNNRGTFANWYLVKVDVDQMPSEQSEAFGVPLEYIPMMVKLDEQGKVAGSLGGEGFGVDPTPEHVDEVFKKFLGS